MRIVVGLSGGVDSSVAAWQLQQDGHEVIGIFMRNWHDESVVLDNACPWIDDTNDAMMVANHLGIPFQVLDLSDAYRERIVDYMFAEYAVGRTPNPDVLCNREIKFDLFLKAARQVGAEMVATGHYCQKETVEVAGSPVHRLLAGADGNKDQSYFLCQLSQDQLAAACFPIGHLEKPRVREIAREIGLPTADKKDSQGLCFIGKVRLPEFLQQQLAPVKGDIVEIPPDHPRISSHLDRVTPITWQPKDGEIVGEHQGAHYFTVGQRKGLNVGGTQEALFVLARDVETNTIYVGQGARHPALLRKGLRIEAGDEHWIRPDHALAPGESIGTYRIRFRYRQPLQAASLKRLNDGSFHVLFETPQVGIASGQFAAWYEGEELIGSGAISD